METRWLYVTRENFPALRDEAKGVSVIPMGCVEKHGLHLPLGTDIFRATAVGYLASQLEPYAYFRILHLEMCQRTIPICRQEVLHFQSIRRCFFWNNFAIRLQGTDLKRLWC